MRKVRAIVIADHAAPVALKLVAAANLLFLGSFLVALLAAADLARP
jgi:hypothetical protein